MQNDRRTACPTAKSRQFTKLAAGRMQSCPTTARIVLMTSLAPELSLLYPLNEFYDQLGLPLPTVVRVEDRDIPEPYKSLLAHSRDMTPTLAEAYQRGIQLRVLKYRLRDDVFSREIILVTEGEEEPVVFGAIKIYLDRFPVEARRLVLEMKQPLGTILQTQGIAHTSRPEAYIRVTADATINSALGLTGSSQLLYGRRNVLWNAAQQPLAQVVEILPPSES
jgi:chorismate-pyruvate lyase